MANLEQLLDEGAGKVALVVGNGINQFDAPPGVNSWNQLLLAIARNCGLDIAAVPPGTTLTEFFDVVDLRTPGRSGDLAAEFCKLMAKWRPLDHHRAIMAWADRHGAPVLTTNFEEVLSVAANCTFRMPRGDGFSDFYPWECRFAHGIVDDPCSAFGIWHINGMARYKRSIRLGLTHYMGSVQRARGWLYRGGKPLFSGKHAKDWPGASTWLQIAFTRPLLFFGLALAENEVFLRWLLIERARYFRKFRALRQPAWYVYVHDPDDEREAGKIFFLEELGITCVRAADYAAIYGNPGWAA
ncbi:SIR2 family protein [Flavisphingomonas formosensis]|uniref:hypothetical protein n=1 Tax=Flavisphingomonas formosensis TaxID=861534 RepID=UPI0012F9CC9B|nr:hypothetical protein [Sphingomonas formosensis]